MIKARFAIHRNPAIAAALLLISTATVFAQDRLPSAPGYDAYRAMDQQTRDARRAMLQGAPNSFAWTVDGSGLVYSKDGKQVKYDFATGRSGDPGPNDKTAGDAGQGRGRRFRGGGPGRGRQFASEDSPDGKL